MFRDDTFQNMNNKGADHTAQMCRLVCACVVRRPPKTGFLAARPISFHELKWKLTTVDPQERSTWRSGVRFVMRAASQLPGRGPTDVNDAPAPAR